MNNQEFEHATMQYYTLFEQGLKKQANQYIANAAKELEATDEAEREEILSRFTRELCDGDKYDYLTKRGNGKVPFALERLVKKWLYQRCQAGKMPEMRWFYELFRGTDSAEDAYVFLDKAYESSECDTKTVNLFFDSYVAILDWGAHHFPEACIISDAERDRVFAKCREILAEKTVDEKLQADFKYYENLYACYDKYCRDGKTRDFQQYCAEAGLAFDEGITIYYEK